MKNMWLQLEQGATLSHCWLHGCVQSKGPGHRVSLHDCFKVCFLQYHWDSQPSGQEQPCTRQHWLKMVLQTNSASSAQGRAVRIRGRGGWRLGGWIQTGPWGNLEETVQRGELPSIKSDKCGATGGRQSLRDLQVSVDDEEHLLGDDIKGSR